MAEQTKIEWADKTFNPWEGCQSVSPGCDHCYAEARNVRFGGGNWGPGAPRRRTSVVNWRGPLRWQREAERTGARPFVFCASLADVFDNAVSAEWRADLWALIKATPNLVWLLLTKRPMNIAKMLPAGGLPRNVALLTSVVTAAEVDRNCRALLDVPGALFYGVSAEPLLEDIAEELEPFLHETVCLGQLGADRCGCGTVEPAERRITWVIVGGESGPRARPMDPEWARSLREVAGAAQGVVFNYKQAGGRVTKGETSLDGETHFGRPAVLSLEVAL